MAAHKQVRKKVTISQQHAIEVLLIGGSDQQAADKAGVSRSTVTKWRNNRESAFAEALAKAREDMRRRQGARLQAAGALAVRALEEGVKDTRSPSARIAAARAILDQGLKASASESGELEVPTANCRANTSEDEKVMSEAEVLSLLARIARTGKTPEQLRAAELLGRQLGMFREAGGGDDEFPSGVIILPAQTTGE